MNNILEKIREKENNPTSQPKFEIKPLVGTPLDYSDKSNWMFCDNLDDQDHEVDVFFLYPTSVSAEVTSEVCEDIQFMKKNAHVTYLQAADTFASFTNIYAPYYRQLSGACIIKNNTADKLMNGVIDHVTRTDVYAALDYYFAHFNQGKPYILAGHSQGSCSLKVVLSEYMKLHPEYMKNLIACYAIGYYFPHSWFDENPQIKKASGEADTGVLITWNTEGSGAEKFNLPLGNYDAFCINPLNWKTDETPADISLNKGSVFVDSNLAQDVFNHIFSDSNPIKDKVPIFSGIISNEQIANAARAVVTKHTEGVADATINKSRGAIVTTTYKAFIPDNPIFGDKSCHFEDWSLFTMNIRENAKKRIAAFLGHEGK